MNLPMSIVSTKKLPRRMLNTLAFFVLALILSNVSCWGLVGHEVVGAIADSQLNSNGKAFVKKVLESYVAPDGKKFTSLKELAPYADNLRSMYDWANNFHFVNIPSDNQNVTIIFRRFSHFLVQSK
jgi:hypothetical protein